GRRSPRQRDPALEELAAGQRVMEIFRLVEWERGRHLTLLLDGSRLLGKMAVTYEVSAPARTPTQSRLVVKLACTMARLSPLRALLPAGDLVMMRKQLLTLKALSEEEWRQASSG